MFGYTAAYIALYVLLDWLSYVRPFYNLGITAWNPQSGLTLIFLLFMRPRFAVATAAAALISELLIHRSPAEPVLLLASSAWIAITYAGLASLLRKLGMPARVESSGMAARFALAALLMTLIVAVGYVSIFASAGLVPTDLFDENVMRYWVGDVNGVLTVTPLLLCLSQWRVAFRTISEQRWLVLAQLCSLLLTLALILGFFANHQLRDFYLVFLPVIWIALRWGVPGGLLSALAIQIGVILGLQRIQAPLTLMDLQFVMLTVNATALLLGAAITDRSHALRRVAAQESEQRALLAMAPDAVLAIDTAGQVLSANPAARRLFGEIADAHSRPRLNELLPSFVLDSAAGRVIAEGRRADGHIFPTETAWARLEKPANAGFLVIVRDATERFQAQAQLRERDTALARAMRFAVAGELASALTHELNQPITALVSYLRASEILAAPLVAGDERLQATLRKAVREAIRASQVLLRLRDFYQSGTIRREPMDATALCHAVAAAFQERLRRARIDLTLRLPPQLPVEADSTQLEIVLHNLVANAIDAILEDTNVTREILVSGELTDCEVRLSITDSGPGVAPDIRGKIFEPFLTSKSDGMGLGLAISKSLLRSQGGELTYEPSAESGGACFRVHLPRCRPEYVSGIEPEVSEHIA